MKSLQSGHVVVGGGLAGGLIALALANEGRGRDVVLIERDRRIGGNHTWAFHATDLTAEGHALVEPLVTRTWPTHVVKFPELVRTLRADYRCITAATFRGAVTERLLAAGVTLRLGRDVTAVGASDVRLDDGTTIAANVVIDARGPEVAASEGTGFQKFVGLELELLSDGPWTQPVLMDATVPQLDGYRFAYVLPFSARRVLVEDTMYSRSPRLDVDAIERRVLAYAEAQGARIARVARREVGVLPLPLRPALDEPPGDGLSVGYRGGFFHPVTGYSLPLAVRVALAVAKARTRAQTQAALGALRRQLAPQRRFGALLNRLMFEGMPADLRWTALERFYRLPEPTIARFYASASTWWDRARIVVGRPPRGLSWRHFLSPQRGET